MRILDTIGDWFRRFGRWAAGALVPMFVRPVPPVALAGVVHFLLVVAVAFALYYLQPILGITDKIGLGPIWLRRRWLSVLFLLGYALLWAVVSLWHSLAPNQPVTDFPDLDAAWDEILAALQKAGIGVADTPIFLVLGPTPANALETLFRGTPRGVTVACGTAAASPLRAYANSDAIYVALPGASLLGDPARSQNPQAWLAPSGSIGASIMVKTMGAGVSVGAQDGAALKQLQSILAQAGDRPLNDEEKANVRKLSGSPPDDQRALDEAADRLYHVCGRIAAARWPLCPLNGAILMVPLDATRVDEAAQQWGLVAQQELAVIEAGMKLHFPVHVLVGGTEELPGGRLFFDRFGADNSAQRFGKGFPLNPDADAAAIAPAIEASIQWTFENLIPRAALQLMRVDPAGGGKDVAANSDLVRFLAETKSRGPHLARLVSRATASVSDRKPLFGGCYLWVVAKGKSDEAKFVREFFKKVESSQGSVSWSLEARVLDASYRSLTKIGYTALGLVLAGVIGFAVFVIATKFGR